MTGSISSQGSSKQPLNIFLYKHRLISFLLLSLSAWCIRLYDKLDMVASIWWCIIEDYETGEYHYIQNVFRGGGGAGEGGEGCSSVAARVARPSDSFLLLIKKTQNTS